MQNTVFSLWLIESISVKPADTVSIEKPAVFIEKNPYRSVSVHFKPIVQGPTVYTEFKGQLSSGWRDRRSLRQLGLVGKAQH